MGDQPAAASAADETLVAGARSGDRAAFGVLVERYETMLPRLLGGEVPVRGFWGRTISLFAGCGSRSRCRR